MGRYLIESILIHLQIYGLYLYAYCDSDPVNNVDPSGFKSESNSEMYNLFAAALDLAIGFGMSVKAIGLAIDIKSTNWKLLLNKYNTELKGISKGFKVWEKISKAIAIFGVVLSVYENYNNDLSNGLSYGRRVSNLIVNTAVSCATTFGIGAVSGAFGAKIGAMVGSFIPIPGVGTIIGGAIGFAVGYGIGFLVDWILEYEFDGKSVMDYLRDGFYSVFKYIRR